MEAGGSYRTENKVRINSVKCKVPALSEGGGWWL